LMQRVSRAARCEKLVNHDVQFGFPPWLAPGIASSLLQLCFYILLATRPRKIKISRHVESLVMVLLVAICHCNLDLGRNGLVDSFCWSRLSSPGSGDHGRAVALSFSARSSIGNRRRSELCPIGCGPARHISALIGPFSDACDRTFSVQLTDIRRLCKATLMLRESI
jgi:hypothetical protein